MREPFQDALEAMLSGDMTALDPWLASDERSRAGLDVYRNTTAKACADALAGLYPTVQRLVGEIWFRDAALIYADGRRPAMPVLDDYAPDFAGWLAGFRPARDLPFLAPVARLDRAWSEAHRAIDSPVLNGRDIAGVAAPALFAARAALHPSARLFWFDWSAPSIWLANRPDVPRGQAVTWAETPEGLAILRPGGAVIHRRLSRTEWLFLDACRRGETLGRAANLALRHDPATDLGALFAGLIGAGLFTRIDMEPVRS